MKKNAHITKYLDYYISLPQGPQFAVLLRGNWGSGKSWFMRHYIAKKGGQEFLYVSLNGITSYKEIEDAFFEQLHPILSSKGMKIASKLIKGILKSTLKFDIDDSNAKELTVPGNLLELSIPDYLKRVDGRTLVFDDLERCGIPVFQILGYINQFVEVNGLKVIVIANETEIITQDKKNNLEENARRYLTIKEKLIGKSFDIESDEEQAIATFIQQLEKPACRSFIKIHKGEVTSIYNIANYQNLRHLQQALLDFDRFYGLLDDNARTCRPLMIHLFNLFLIISIELKKGAVSEDDIPEFFSLAHISEKKNDVPSRIDSIKSKYPFFHKYLFHPLTPEQWTELFKTGTLDRNELNNSLYDTSYLSPEQLAAWQQLYYFDSLEEDVFKKTSSQVYDQLRGSKYTNPYIIVQATGILIYLIDQDLSNHVIDQILDFGKKSLLRLKSKNLLNHLELRDFPGVHSHGLGYAAKNNPSFASFLEYCKQLIKEVEEESYPKAAERLMATFKSFPREFCKKLDHKSPANIQFTQGPVLKYIDANEFVKHYMTLANSWKKEVSDVLSSRYASGFTPFIASEREWLEQVLCYLNEQQPSIKGTVAGFVIRTSMIPTIEKSLKIIG